MRYAHAHARACLVSRIRACAHTHGESLKIRGKKALKGHDQNVSAYSRRSVNSGGVVNLTFTYVYVRTYVVGAYWIAALCNLISTP